MADKSKAFSLKRIIGNDKSLIFFSLVLAVIIWIAASLNIGTNVTKTITKTVNIDINSEFAEQNNLEYYSLKDSVDVSVTISGEKYVVGQAGEEDISFVFDTQGVTGTGNQSVRLVANNNSDLDFDIVSQDVTDVDVYIDTPANAVFGFSELSVPITAAKGYFIGDFVLSEYEVAVSGPKTYVDSITGVDLAIPPQTDCTESYAGDCQINVRGLTNSDKNFLRITSTNNDKTQLDSIYVTVPVLKETTLPVTVSFDNLPQKVSKDVFKIECEPAEMTVGVLEGAKVTEITAGNIPIEDICPNPNDVEQFAYSTSFLVKDIEGVTFKDSHSDSDEVKVTVTLNEEYEVTQIPVAISDIEFTNPYEGFDATKLTDGNKDFKSVWVVAPTKKVEGSTAKTVEVPTIDNIKLTCDLSVKNADGTYPVTVTVNNDYSWAGGKYNVMIA